LYETSGREIAVLAAIVVPDNYPTIQEAINNANAGDTVVVSSGIYYEHVIVNKTITLLGEDNTIIDGRNSGTVLQITADNVTITGFQLQYSGWGWNRNGIYVYKADNCEIRNNILYNNCHNIRINCSSNTQVLGNKIEGEVVGYGIRLINSRNCVASGNNVSDCIGGVHLQNATNCLVRNNLFTKNSQGVRLYSPCVNNEIILNIVINNTYDGMIEIMPGNTTLANNVFYHNNFVNNTNPFIYKVSGNSWDNGYPSGGNYWTRHNSTDVFSGLYQNQTGSDGILDTPYSVNNFDVDQFPLAHPFGSILNQNTSRIYLTIQTAIDAPETLDGHVLHVGEGIYYEHVKIRKSLTLLGESKETILDGGNVGTVLHINANNVSITKFTIRNSGANFPPYDCGIFLNHSEGCKIGESLIINNRIGLYLYFSQLNIIEQNVVQSNHEYGVWLWYSGSNVLIGNNISNNTYNFGVFGGSFSNFNNTIDDSNTVDGKPIKYIIGSKNEILDNQTEIGTLYLINSYNVTVKNLRFTKSGHAIFCYNITNSRIENVTAFENAYGIYLQSSHNNTVRNSRCVSNWVGIGLQDSNNNAIINNYAANCEKGISLYEASNNIITSNTLQNNVFGIRMFSAHFNKAFHNNLIENTEQASLIISLQNVWDNGFEGNFWSNYEGFDTNRDGVGENPQIIDSSQSDQHPLLGYYTSSVAMKGEKCHDVSVITNSTMLAFYYDAISNTITITVNGSEGTCGFCRVSVPHALILPELSVKIDDGLTEVLYSNYNLFDDGSFRWIYVEYPHSTREIVIIPEYICLTTLTVLAIASFSALMVKKMT